MAAAKKKVKAPEPVSEQKVFISEADQYQIGRAHV